MVRSAAKNWKRRGGADRRVAVRRRARRAEGATARVEPRDALRAGGGGVQPHRQLRRGDQRLPVVAAAPTARAAEFPAQSNGRFVKLQDLRYGENPHQSAAFYRDLHPAPGSLVTARAAAGQGALLQQHRRRRRGLGMREELRPQRRPACVIVKHANPCGVALGADARRGLRQGLQDRPDLGLRRHHRLQLPSSTARRAALVAKQFVEVLIAPALHARGAGRASPPRRTCACCRSRCRRAATTAVGAGPQRARREARRLGPADPERRQPRARARRAEGGDASAADAGSSSTTCCSPGRSPST